MKFPAALREGQYFRVTGGELRTVDDGDGELSKEPDSMELTRDRLAIHGGDGDGLWDWAEWPVLEPDPNQPGLVEVETLALEWGQFKGLFGATTITSVY